MPHALLADAALRFNARFRTEFHALLPHRVGAALSAVTFAPAFPSERATRACERSVSRGNLRFRKHLQLRCGPLTRRTLPAA
jgi:hypothetical protein